MTESIDYNTDLEQLLKLHAEECESLSILHRNSYEKYNGRSNYINIPVIKNHTQINCTIRTN